MDDINRKFLYPLWGSSVTYYKFDLTSRSIHLKLFRRENEERIWTQIDICNVRMFSYATMDCYADRAKEDSFPVPVQERYIPPRGSLDNESGIDDFLKEYMYSGTYLEVEEIETAKPGQANVKVYFNYQHPAPPRVPWPYFDKDQNITIEFGEGSILTISAQKVAVNGNWFIWDQEAGTFVPTKPSEDGTPAPA